MKKIAFTLVLAMCMSTAFAQKPQTKMDPISFDTVGADTTRAIAVIDRYIKMVDFTKSTYDSLLCVVTYAIDRSHPNDTITIYRWYKAPNYTRVEIWQGGQLQDGYYSDGVKLFRKFHVGRREWTNITSDSYFQIIMPLDIRGALYNWRKKGAEVFYAGEVNYEGKVLDRLFVTMPNTFDRYYYFERETGLQGFLVEENHIYGDLEASEKSVRVDWHAWHEFVPIKGFLLPREESYQVGNSQIVFQTHQYHYEALQPKLFTEDFHRKP